MRISDVHLFTYTVQSTRRSSNVGLHSGSHGSARDDFRFGPLRKK